MFCIKSCKQDRQELIFESVSFALINLKCLFSRTFSNLFFSKENTSKNEASNEIQKNRGRGWCFST